MIYIPSDFMNYDSLIREQSCFNGIGIKPSEKQSIQNLKNIFVSIIKGESNLAKLGKQNSLIVLGLDAISYNVAKNCFTPTTIFPLTSTFPTTSVTAWTTTVSGLSPSLHNLPGVVYFAPEINKMYNCLDNAILIGNEWKTNYINSKRIRYGKYETFFNLINKFAETVVIDGYFSYDIARWSSCLIQGASKVQKSKSDWSTITFSPNKIIDSIIEDVEFALITRNQSKKLFLWSLVNTDHYIHVNGYSEELNAQLERLNQKILQWNENGHTVIIHSDHGQVKNFSDKKLEDCWNYITSEELSNFCGGAGRTRWIYPKKNCETKLVDKLEKEFGNLIKIIHKNELHKLGLLNVDDSNNRIGTIVVIAIDHTFPIINSAENYYSKSSIKYEHGSILPDEMIVPLVIYNSI